MIKKIITCLMALVLMSACSQQKVEVSKEKKKETPDWIIQYRDYLKKAKKDPEHRLYEKDAKVGIANIYDDETPTLFVITDNDDNEEQDADLLCIFYQYEDESVTEKTLYSYYSSIENEGSEYVYDKIDKKYEWYNRHYLMPGSDIYMFIPVINSDDNYVILYVWDDGAVKNNDSFHAPDAIDFEDRFISTGITLNSYDRFDLTEDMTDASFEKSMLKLEEDYETVMETIPEDVEKKVETEEYVESTDPTPTDALQVGDFTLKYGTYVSDQKDIIAGGEYTINPDGTFTYSNVWKNYDGDEFTDTANGTYEISYEDISAPMVEIHDWQITFTYANYTSTYVPVGDHTDPDFNSFVIRENNSFQYLQSEGIFRLQ